MSYDTLDFDDDFDRQDENPPEESGNRTFLALAGILGAIAVVALICIAVYALMILPGQRETRAAYQATLNAQNTEVASIINQTATSAAMTAFQASFTHTPTATELLPAATATIAPTSVVVLAQISTFTPTLRPEMATATVLNATILANAEQYSATSTAQAMGVEQAIPDTGFADEVGLPILLGMAVLLMAVFFLARRLRMA
jgi:LPXTG-motif cell wall-anchored protein